MACTSHSMASRTRTVTVLGTAEATTPILGSVLGPSLEERHWSAMKKGSRAGEGFGVQV